MPSYLTDRSTENSIRIMREAYLELLSQVFCHRHQRAGDLDDVDRAPSEPRAVEDLQEVFTHNECADAGGESKHFVKADGHRVDRGVRQRDLGGGCEGGGVQRVL